MAGLIGDLLTNARSLATQSKGIELAGKNLANVNNPNYARQRLILGDRGTIDTPIGPQSMGTEALGIQQIRDQFLDVQVVREASQTGLLQAQDTNLQKAQANLGEQVDGSSASASISDSSHSTHGISTSLNDFFNAFENLSASPTDAGAKQVLLEKAGLLASKFNVTDSRLSQQQTDYRFAPRVDPRPDLGVYGLLIFLINEAHFQSEAINTAYSVRFAMAALDHAVMDVYR